MQREIYVQSAPPIADVEGLLCYEILYKGLEHSWILVDAGFVEPIPPQMLRDDCYLIWNQIWLKLIKVSACDDT